MRVEVGAGVLHHWVSLKPPGNEHLLTFRTEKTFSTTRVKQYENVNPKTEFSKLFWCPRLTQYLSMTLLPLVTGKRITVTLTKVFTIIACWCFSFIQLQSLLIFKLNDAVHWDRTCNSSDVFRSYFRRNYSRIFPPNRLLIHLLVKHNGKSSEDKRMT